MVSCIEMAVKLCSIFLSKEGEICYIILMRPTAPTLLFEGKNPVFFTYSLASTARHFNRWTTIVILSKCLAGAMVQSSSGGLFVMPRPFL